MDASEAAIWSQAPAGDLASRTVRPAPYAAPPQAPPTPYRHSTTEH